MTTTSFPITGDNITHAQWSSLGSHADGIREGDAFVLSSTTDELTVPSGTKIGCKGFLLDVTADEVLTLPAVTSDTVYRVGVMYDPADEAAAGGPLELVAPIAGSEGVPAGGAFLPLQDITRRNGVALSASTVQDYRYFNNGGLVAADSGLALPPAEFYSKGASLILPTGLYLHDGSDWVAVEDDTGWRTDGWGARAGWASVGSQWRIRNGLADVRFRARRTGGNLVSSSAGQLGDQEFLGIPAAVSPGGWLIAGQGYVSSGGTFAFDWRIYGGDIGITSCSPSSTIQTSGVLYGNATYLL